MKQRETWIDIAKGLGIILVVIGHSGNAIAHHYIFWFHMPLFFILSGYTFKDITTMIQFKDWAIKNIKRSLIPYFSYGMLILILYSFVSSSSGKFTWRETATILKNLVYGGQELTGYFGVFWFITCLLITQILFAIVLVLFKSHFTRLIVIASCYLLAHLESRFLPQEVSVPWNADVALLAIVYFSLGWYMKKFGKELLRNTAFIGMSIALLAVTLVYEFLYGIDYILDMKYRFYTDWAFDLYLPALFSVAVLLLGIGLSKFSGVNSLGKLGEKTLPIMYLHIPLNLALQAFLPDYDWILFSIVGLFFPLVFNWISEKYSFTRFLFAGKPFNLRKDQTPKTITSKERAY